tara:strand:+ start:2212 stop:2658 length:447 start_codon:yes stop_codon:yes gene_type:complete
MAHFAELKTKVDPTGFTTDTHQVVERVVVVGNDCVPSDMHADGETWCINFFKGGIWKQTSYNNNFRKSYAGMGMVYDPVKDKFLQPQPHASWSLDASDDWKAPVIYPTDTTDKFISWDEENLKWTATDNSDPVNNFNWDASALAWVSA